MQNRRLLSPASGERFDLLLQRIAPSLGRLTGRDGEMFKLRLLRWFQSLDDGLSAVYGRDPGYQEVLERLVLTLLEVASERPEELRQLDYERELTPDWFQHEGMFGYVMYVDRFAGTLRGILDHLDYLDELGVRYLHLMGVVRPRSGENDGGYAIADYLDIDPRVGTLADFEEVCAVLRRRGIATCIDLVLNHCADTHPWAEAALAGDARARGYFYTFDSRREVDAYEASLLEIFPDFSPGNFTYQPHMECWVWTTFHRYQWDLNWSNPEVLLDMVRIMGVLANRGVDVLRLDAVAFMWKRLGTNCQNQPEVHDLLQALRACAKIATPAMAHKAEAIVAPSDLVHYFGTGRRYGKVANIAYHNSLMVQGWSALASGDARLMTHTLAAFPQTPSSIAWGTYVRCHDDIGWAVTDEDAAAVGLSGPAHRGFLSDFYSGTFPGSYARGALFQHNPLTGDRRISGSCASLAGLEAAYEEGEGGAKGSAVDLAIERILWLHAVAAGFGGVPLLYMGDELGMLNDPSYALEPDLADDNRWMHRPRMNWTLAERRYLSGTAEARIFAGVRNIVRARSRTPHLHAQTAAEVLDLGHPALYAQLRRHPLGPFLGVYNVRAEPQQLSSDALRRLGWSTPFDQLGQRYLDLTAGFVELPPYARWWLV